MNISENSQLYQSASNKKVIIMCKKLKALSGLSADEILELQHKIEIPINIERILKTLKIQYAPMDFSKTEEIIPEIIKKRGRILGAVTVVDDDVNIFYSSNEKSEHRKRFTLAHELAHCCLNATALKNKGHIEFRFDEKSEHPMEVAANSFAGRLLIPERFLIPMYKNMIAPLSDVLAREFDVSVSVMEGRLRDLGLPFYTYKASEISAN